MNKFKQYIPAFIDTRGDDNIEYEFKTTKDLLSIIPVKLHSNSDNFSHFAMSGNSLMAIYDEGFEHWVVGYIKSTNGIDIPEWEGWKFRAELRSGEKTILKGDEVISSCGNLLTLKDGSKAKNLGR